ncbi:hypothetical protein A8F94_08940 [Bacillus sp. FJAT-27225]|uniref:SMI1/KNR4 family protein n=1 Tax=Bacillus sp. FJAT-27225 TaxID=1743144 RepID=UPI00080C29A1|nr:SMI1/KNR4 family protein [Bacillus sp. FJAT-27225]OCA87943.1 hypothetical protein A8F94_08940 [Bacillus sp. FJAT-27225]
MNYNEFLKIVNEARDKRPIWLELESEPKAKDYQIEKAEKVLSLTLPDEYKSFVKDFGGGYFAFTTLFSVSPGDWNIVSLNKELGFMKTHSFLAVSDVGTGDFFGFSIERGVCGSRIMFYDHETNKVEETNYENLFDYLIEVGLNQSV